MHVPTLLYVMSSVTLFAAIVMLREAFERKGAAPELGWWSAGFFSLTVGGVLSNLRVFHLDFLAYGGSNAFIIVGYVLIWRGVRQFCGQTLSLAWLAAGPLWVGLYAFTPLLVGTEQRVVGMSSFAVFASVACALDLLALRKPSRAARDLAILYLAHAVFYLIRIATVWSDGAIIDVRALTGLTFTLVIFEAVIFVVVASYFLLTMTRERAFGQMQAASETDYLTGIGNRRAFTAKAEDALGDALRNRRSAALLLFDLDHFKRINDLHGHSTGDEVLKHFCRVVEEHLRTGEIFGRLGGEEFAALLPDTDAAQAGLRARAIREAFASSSRTLDGRDVGATVSIGVATTAGTFAQDVTALLSHADQALYLAKLRGRNRVELAEEHPGTTPPEALPAT